MRVAFVVQRYGVEVNGGAEMLCRSIAELFNDKWDIQVLTTCALDYITWRNHYPEGLHRINNVLVHRFPVKSTRNNIEFSKLSAKIYGNAHTRKDEIHWMRSQGPDAPGLTQYVGSNKDKFDFFIFFTYLYGTTFWSLPLVAEKAFLAPTAHDEPPIYLSIFDELFRMPKGFIFNTPEEKEFVIDRFNIDCEKSEVIGVGVQLPSPQPEPGLTDSSLPDNYIIYAGRIDESKGCGTLFEYWSRYKKDNNDVRMVLIGRSNMEIPNSEDMIPLGFVSEAEKYALISNSKCLIMPSSFESFSIVLLEAWLCGRPVLVNGKCAVLKGQCRRSNGGLWYENYEEFEACMNFLLNNEELAVKMALCGKKYTDENYHWDIIKKKYIRLIK